MSSPPNHPRTYANNTQPSPTTIFNPATTPATNPLFPQGLHLQIFTMSNMIPLAGRLTAYTFGTFCLLSALPFIGVPFPSRAASDYYVRKNAWLANISPIPMTPIQAGYFGAVLRITLGLGLISQRYRMASLAVMGSVVGVGTVLAYRDERRMRPQWQMLGYTTIVFLLNRRW